jgi:hypothetical protein
MAYYIFQKKKIWFYHWKNRESLYIRASMVVLIVIPSAYIPYYMLTSTAVSLVKKSAEERNSKKNLMGRAFLQMPPSISWGQQELQINNYRYTTNGPSECTVYSNRFPPTSQICKI